MKKSLFMIVALLAGVLDSCKHPTETNQTDTTTHVDTTHHAMDTTSHNFSWKEYTLPSENNLTGVWVFGPRDIITVNDVLYRFNGYSWVRWDLPTDAGHNLGALSGFSIFGFTPNDFWLTFGGILYHYDGTVAHEIRLDRIRQSNGALLWEYPTDGSIHSAWGTSSKDMFFVGDSGTILHFDGTNWMKFPKVTTKDLRSISGISSVDVWASGYNSTKGETVLLHFDGATWKEDNLSASQGLNATGGFNAVWTCDSASHTFVTTSGALLKRKTDFGLWRSDSGLIPNRLDDGTFIGISPIGNTANDLFVAGGWGFLAHWNGRNWLKYNQFFSYGTLGYGAGAFSMRGNTICIAGIKNGQSWILLGQR